MQLKDLQSSGIKWPAWPVLEKVPFFEIPSQYDKIDRNKGKKAKLSETELEELKKESAYYRVMRVPDKQQLPERMTSFNSSSFSRKDALQSHTKKILDLLMLYPESREQFATKLERIKLGLELLFGQFSGSLYQDSAAYLPREVTAMLNQISRDSVRTVMHTKTSLETIDNLHKRKKSIDLNRVSTEIEALIQLCAAKIDKAVRIVWESHLMEHVIPWEKYDKGFEQSLEYEKSKTTIMPMLSNDMRESTTTVRNVLSIGSIHGLLKRVMDLDIKQDGTSELRKAVIKKLQEYTSSKFLIDIVRIQKKPFQRTVSFLFNRLLILDALANVCERNFTEPSSSTVAYDDAQLLYFLKACQPDNKIGMKWTVYDGSQQQEVLLAPFVFRFGFKHNCMLFDKLLHAKLKTSVTGMVKRRMLHPQNLFFAHKYGTKENNDRIRKERDEEIAEKNQIIAVRDRKIADLEQQVDDFTL